MYILLAQAVIKCTLRPFLTSKLTLTSTFQANATRRPPIHPIPRQVPQGFFDGVQNHYPPSPQLRRRSLVPSWGLRPRALLARLPQPFHRSQPNADESTELQQRPGPSTSPRRIPPIVEVPCIDDKKALYTTRPLETASEMAKRIKNPKWWVRVVLFICCVSPGTNDGPGTNDNPGANISPGTNNTPGINNSLGTDGAQHHPST
ncbi:hypothetical protein P692DRAFT_201807489 [Suillus brevipes Sb2]|nr:hypothetical protein P692DRAFT_201807489 [Suillus brevipes Sb2]